MEQKSDVEFRAEKLYKNAREKFGYLIREVVSNAIHATLIRSTQEDVALYKPVVTVAINQDKGNVEIVVSDNGEGFTELNSKYFTHLDTRNPQKEKLQLHPKGQGRLAMVYFADRANFNSIYKTVDAGYLSKSFDYPELSLPLFDIEDAEGIKTDKTDTGTVLTLKLTKQQTCSRANTFFAKYSDIEKLKNWFIENFFPFFMEYERLQLQIYLNGQMATLNRSYIEKTVSSIPFKVEFDDETKSSSDFQLWLVKKEETPKTRNQIVCFARHLCAEMDEGKIEYEIDLPHAYDWFLISEPRLSISHFATHV